MTSHVRAIEPRVRNAAGYARWPSAARSPHRRQIARPVLLWRESNTVKTCEDDVRAHGPGGWWSRDLGVNLEARSVDATQVARQSVNPMGKAIEAFVRARLGRTEPAGTREEAPRG